LILAGSDDPIIPLVNARVMHRLLPRAEVHAYDDGHLGLVTGAGKLAPRIADFLRS
jgi:pimeloyl-ACP methyl ester carboxylesterase